VISCYKTKAQNENS